MKLRPMNTTLGEERLRLASISLRPERSWTVYMHPIVAIDGGWFLPEHSGAELRKIWLNRGSARALLPTVLSDDIWRLWRDVEPVAVAMPTAIILNRDTKKAVMLNTVDDLSVNSDDLKNHLTACNSISREIPSLMFTEQQLLSSIDDVMMWLHRSFLDYGQSHLALVGGKFKQVVA